jgi:hypothetical protein
MPCCALAACIVGQLILGFVAVKRALFGGATDAGEESNAAVLWRLDSPVEPALAPIAGRAWAGGRRGVRRLVLIGAIELVLVLGAAYGVREHFAHHGSHAEHAAHAHGAAPAP